MKNLLGRIDRKQDIALYVLLLIMPFIDMLTGAILNAGSTHVLGKIGQLYRIVFWLYLAYVLFWQNRCRNTKWLLVFTGYVFGLVAVYYLRFGSSIVTNASYALKLIFPIYLAYGLAYKTNRGEFDINKILEFYVWVFPLSMLIPRMLGLGYYNYYNDSGYKGFYFANNEVNVILMVLFVYCLKKLYDKFTVTNLVQLVLCIGALLLIGSKTSFLVIPLATLSFLFVPGKTKKQKALMKKILIYGGILLFFILFFMLEQIIFIVERMVKQMMFYDGYQGGFLTFLLSERNLRIWPAAEHWFLQDPNGLVNLLFGLGKAEKCPEDSIYGLYSIIELDFFDGLFWFGLITIGIVMFFYLRVFIRSLRSQNLFREKVMFCLVLTFSMLAGHVLMSANAGTMLGIVVAGLYRDQVPTLKE